MAWLGVAWSIFSVVLKALWPIFQEILPILITSLKSRDSEILKNARQRALELQTEVATQAKLMKDGKTDEISREDYFKSMVLDTLFKSRELRLRKDSQSTG